MTRIVLVGAGHAHLHVVMHADRLRALGCDVTLIDPGDFWYSGRAASMLGGRIETAADRIDPCPLIEARGGRHHAGRVEHIDPVYRRIVLDDGRAIAYDRLSLNVGSIVARDAIDGCAADPRTWPAKPIAGLARLRDQLQSRLRRGETPRVAVIGGGPTGCEIAANVAGLATRADGRIAIHLLQAADTLATTLPEGARRRLADRLTRRGIRIRCGARVRRRDATGIELDCGEHLAADDVVLAYGLSAPPWLAHTGLAFDDGLVVDTTLRSIDDPYIFAVGDCARLRGHALPRLGVFGVRQATTLLHNLMADTRRAPLSRFEPQSRWLSILDLGDGTGLATRGRLWWHGRSSLWLKRWLDSRFMERYRG